MHIVGVMPTKKLLITGVSGFIGSHFLRKVVEGKEEIVCISRNPAKIATRNPGKRIRIIKWDISSMDEYHTLRLNSELEGITHAFHIAGLMPNHINRNNANLFYLHNLTGTINLIKSLTGSIRWFCFLSTIDVYGSSPQNPIRETTLTAPGTYYGTSKLAAEDFLRVYCEKNNIKLAILRTTQVYGPQDTSAKKLIPASVKRALQGEPIEIYGKGNDERDYLYAEDLAEALLSAKESEAEGIFNIATGTSHTILDVVEKIMNITDSSCPVSFKPAVKAKSQLCFDLKYSQEKLGFKARINLDDGLRRLLAGKETN
jgi:nucleoside-diphosphate-sugar epimerase